MRELQLHGHLLLQTGEIGVLRGQLGVEAWQPAARGAKQQGGLCKGWESQQVCVGGCQHESYEKWGHGQGRERWTQVKHARGGRRAMSYKKMRKWKEQGRNREEQVRSGKVRMMRSLSDSPTNT